MANPPVVGDLYTAVMTFTTRSGLPIDPAWINFYYRTPQTNVLIEKTLASNPSLFRHVATGHYEFDISIAEYGQYKVRYETDLGVMEGSFTSVQSEVL